MDTSEGPSSDMSNIIFVDNLPSAPAAMAPKLVAFGRDKIFAKVSKEESLFKQPSLQKNLTHTHLTQLTPSIRLGRSLGMGLSYQ